LELRISLEDKRAAERKASPNFPKRQHHAEIFESFGSFSKGVCILRRPARLRTDPGGIQKGKRPHACTLANRRGPYADLASPLIIVEKTLA